MNKKILLIIPAYNEEVSIQGVISPIINENIGDIAIVNDGSSDNTEFASKSLQNPNGNIYVLSHPTNIGLGGALSTGLTFAKNKEYDYAITFDADGQHLLQDILKITKEIQKNTSDMIIGSRLKDLKRKYPTRYTVNWISNWVTYILGGYLISDSQSGLRAFNRRALEKVSINTSGYEVSSEIIIKAKKEKLKLEEIPITAVYSEYSLKNGQKLSNSTRLLRKLVFMR